MNDEEFAMEWVEAFTDQDKELWATEAFRQRAELRLEVDRLTKRIEDLEALRKRAYAIVSTLLPEHPRVQGWLTDAVEF